VAGAKSSRAMLSGSRNSRMKAHPDVLDPAMGDALIVEYSRCCVEVGTAG